MCNLVLKTYALLRFKVMCGAYREPVLQFRMGVFTYLKKNNKKKN